MSIHAYAWAWAADAPSPGSKLVLVALADYADETTGEAFPALSTLAKRTGLTRRSVQRGITALVDARLITVEERQRDNGSDTSNLYRLALEPIAYPAERQDEEPRKPRKQGGVNTTPPGRQYDAPGASSRRPPSGGDTVTPPDPFKPSDELPPKAPKGANPAGPPGGRARDLEAWHAAVDTWIAGALPAIAAHPLARDAVEQALVAGSARRDDIVKFIATYWPQLGLEAPADADDTDNDG